MFSGSGERMDWLILASVVLGECLGSLSLPVYESSGSWWLRYIDCVWGTIIALWWADVRLDVGWGEVNNAYLHLQLGFYIHVWDGGKLPHFHLHLVMRIRTCRQD